MTPFTAGLKPPYYAVIFSSTRREGDHGYSGMDSRMAELAATMPGYLGIESARDAQGFGITVSCWRDEDSIGHWRQHAEHLEAQQRGK